MTVMMALSIFFFPHFIPSFSFFPNSCNRNVTHPTSESLSLSPTTQKCFNSPLTSSFSLKLSIYVSRFSSLMPLPFTNIHIKQVEKELVTLLQSPHILFVRSYHIIL